ncbi:MAG: protein kinase [Victivallales bacterium]|nr:protein kinase [Victivallales bacterium]
MTDIQKQISELLKDIVITQQCGRGGFGYVFLADDITLARKVAVKAIEKNKADNFKQEYHGLMTYCSAIHSHANLLTIHYAAQNDKLLAYTMELADNAANSMDNYVPDTLAYRLGKVQRFSPETIRMIVNGLLDGLQELHNAGLAHRDIKPENILFVNSVPKLADFSIMTKADDPLNAGTKSYVPQTIDSTMDSKALGIDQDLYALGKTVYMMFSGQFSHDFPYLRSDLLDTEFGKRLNQFLLFACSNNPDERFRSVQEFRHSFNQCYDDLSFTHSLLFRIASFILALAAMALIILLTLRNH